MYALITYNNTLNVLPKSMLIFNGTPALYIYNTEFYLFPVSTTLIPTVIYYVIIALIHAYLNN